MSAARHPETMRTAASEAAVAVVVLPLPQALFARERGPGGEDRRCRVPQARRLPEQVTDSPPPPWASRGATR